MGLLIVSAPIAAAASQSGYLGCGSKYGWLQTTTLGSGAGSNQITPPGSQLTYVYSSSGTRNVVAAYSNGVSKTGGGSWSAYGSISVYGSTPHCETYG